MVSGTGIAVRHIEGTYSRLGSGSQNRAVAFYYFDEGSTKYTQCCGYYHVAACFTDIRKADLSADLSGHDKLTQAGNEGKEENDHT